MDNQASDLRARLISKVFAELIDAESIEGLGLGFGRGDLVDPERMPADLLDMVANHDALPMAHITLARRVRSHDVLETLARSGDAVVRRLVAGNPATGTETIRGLLKDPDPEVRGRAHSCGALPDGWTPDGDDRSAYENYLHNPNASPSHLATAAQCPDSARRLIAAANQSTPAPSLEALAFDPITRVRLTAVTNPSMSQDTLRAVVNGDANPEVVVDAADHITGDIDVGRFAEAYDERLRNMTARLTTSEFLMVALASDACVDVRSGVAQNPHAPLGVLAELAADTSSEVRRQFAWRSDVPVELVEIMAASDDSYLRARAAENLTLTDAEIRATLASDPAVAVRRAIAKRDDTPGAVLSRLAGDPSLSVRALAVANPHCPTQTLKDRSNDPALRGEALANPAYDADRLPLYLRRASDAIVGARRATEPADLEKLSFHADTSVRVAVTHNDATPLQVLRQLVHDDDLEVCISAALAAVKRLDAAEPERQTGPTL